jgi:UPF0755 protein
MSRLSDEQARAKSRRRRLRSAGIIAAAVVVVAAVVAVTLNVPIPGIRDSGVPPGQPVQVTIPEGAATGEIGRILEDAGVVDSGGALADEAIQQGVDNQLQPGVYGLTTGMDVAEVLDVLVAGPQAAPGDRLTIPEGLTVAQIAARIAESGRWSAEEVQQALADPNLASPYRPQADVPQPLEGLLFPSTYPVSDDTRLPALLQTMLDQMQTVMQRQDFTTARQLNLTDYDVLIVASMVEREALVPEDRPKIAQVIYNRMRAGMRLQIDATVQYALGENRERLSTEDTRVDSPHNTYLNDGLPPTPIAAPGEDAIRAALAPADGPWLYYVRTEQDGRHSFTDSYEEFERLKEVARERGFI